MKALKIISILIIVSLFSCKKGENKSVFYVDVVADYNGGYYYNNDNNFEIDIDLDGVNDIEVDKQQLADTYYDEDLGYYITQYNNSIEFKNKNNIEFSATDDCMDIMHAENEIGSELSYEENATLSNDFNISCNRIMNGRNFLGFRIQKDGKWHYGWMQIYFDLNNNNQLDFEGWAYHNKEGNSIYSNQQE